MSITYKNRTALQWATNNEVYQLLNVHKIRNDYAHTVCTDEIDYDLISNIIVSINAKDKIGAILVFLPGYEEIQSCHDKILKSSLRCKECEIFILHSSVDKSTQCKVFDVLHKKQKIILSTNIAETSLTIPEVVYVINTGMAKEKSYDPITGISCMQTVWVSKSSTKQRVGRAGRTQEGICYHLFSKSRHNAMLQNHIPHIFRESLHGICLKAKMLAPPDMTIAEYLLSAIEPPLRLSVQHSISVLKDLGALTNDEELTMLGKHLLKFTIEPHFAKMLIYSVFLKCLDPVLTIVACMSNREPFLFPQNREYKQTAIVRRQQLVGNSLSDHVLFVKAYNLWQSTFDRRKMKYYFISPSLINTIRQTRLQLLSQLKAIGFISDTNPFRLQDLSTRSKYDCVIGAALSVGCFPKIAFINTHNFSTKMERKVNFFISSVVNPTRLKASNLNSSNQCCILYEELISLRHKHFVKHNTYVTPITIALLCGDDKKIHVDKKITVDNISFIHDYNELTAFCKILDTTIGRKIANPSYIFNSYDNDVLNALYMILYIEESKCGLYGELENKMASENVTDIFQNLSYWNMNDVQVQQPVSMNCNNLSSKVHCGNGDLSCIKDLKSSKQNSYVHGAIGTESNYERLSSANRSISSIDTEHFQSIDSQASYSDRSSRNLIDFIDVVPKNEPDLSSNAIFFVVICSNYEIFGAAITESIWKFALPTQTKILEYFRRNYNIFLFFTISDTDNFQGLAQIMNFDSNNNSILKWWNICNVPYEKISCRLLLDPYSICPDEQLMEHVGKQICSIFFEQIPNVLKLTK